MAYRLDIKERKKGTYLVIEKKFYDKESKKPKTEHYKTLGYLHELQIQHPDPITHFKNVISQMNAEEKALGQATIMINMNENLLPETHARYNMGYAVILNVYHALELDRFLFNKARNEEFLFNTNSIMQLLIITRILHPTSKRGAYYYKDNYFERFDFELHDVYRALSHFSKICSDCQQFISDRIFSNYGRDTGIMYFDVTNFHFEIDRQDDFRRYGKEKNNRPDPIVQLGLAMDANGIPLYYKLFPGNTHDSKTFIPVFKEVCVKFTPGRVIAVADMGCTSGDNIYFLKGGGRDKRVNGYVFSYSVRKASDIFKAYILNDAGYTDRDGKALKKDYDFKIKSRIEVRSIFVTMANGSKKAVQIDEKQVVFWNRKYADRARAEREETINKAHDVIANPQKYNKDTVHGAAAYIKNLTFNKANGEIVENPGTKLTFNSVKADEDAKYDGYYCIITSELEMPDTRVIEIYRGLSDIEDNFKVVKSNMDIRPVYVSREDRINAHVLICFISLVIMRLIQKIMAYKFTPEQIITCLNNISCSKEDANIYLFDYRTDISDEIGKAFNIDFSKRRMFLNKIKNILANSKK